ncbi:hypothetical protein GCM10010329_31000 [Streptomyces spiroverticillatus]|uniref:DUF2306 domain-containing protein n=1 Tax=Streptomyces finlayi TaxID=67296 RepID=A0A918WW26_9ACTN|nr:DUF2306 domain-containing protein [Streptomyces finlayi]GHA06244.1 hypothetical protein GCM10010329_31000 [Streptomyces spiroverticillatus]GHC89885.1 hypothetical protein GCM10010334_23410 [Streptomyces finlayi]
MNHLKQAPWKRIAAVATVVVCVTYAPVAMTELWPYARPGAPAIGEWVLGKVVTPGYVAEALATRIAPYGRSLIPLVVHSVLGGALMLLGPVQLLSAVRRRARLHRIAGVAFAVTVYASMAGAALYLLRTAPEDAFGGASFWIVLATILLGTVLSVTFGTLAAVRRMPELHQRWMLLCYGFLMTAPLLRLEWGGLPLLLPGLPMEEINRVAIMHLGSLVVFGALLASRGMDRRGKSASMEGTWAPGPVLVLAHLAGAAGLVWITTGFLSEGASGRRLLGGFLIPYVITYAVMIHRHRAATRRGDSWAREEWRLHLTALCLAPALSAALALPLQHAMSLDRYTALASTVGIGCGVTAFAATTLLSLRVVHAHETARRASAPPLPHPTAPRTEQAAHAK